MDHTYQTHWELFLVIVLAYVGLSLMIGAKKAYFEPFNETNDAVDENAHK